MGDGICVRGAGGHKASCGDVRVGSGFKPGGGDLWTVGGAIVNVLTCGNRNKEHIKYETKGCKCITHNMMKEWWTRRRRSWGDVVIEIDDEEEQEEKVGDKEGEEKEEVLVAVVEEEEEK